LIKNTGEVSAHYQYDPFGNTLTVADSTAFANPYRFSTKPLEEFGDLYYYGRRYYASNRGNWLGRDPIKELDCLNLFLFVRNEPVSQNDVLGLYVFQENANTGSGKIGGDGTPNSKNIIVNRGIYLHWHYLFGNGSALILGDQFMRDFLDASRNSFNNLHDDVILQIAGKAECTKKGLKAMNDLSGRIVGTLSLDTPAEHWTNAFWNDLMILNQGTLEIKYKCSLIVECICKNGGFCADKIAGNCEFQYYFSDRYANPQDTGGAYHEGPETDPFGTPYDIKGNWSEKKSIRRTGVCELVANSNAQNRNRNRGSPIERGVIPPGSPQRQGL
jgi:RHS repeat-associated protein